MLDSQLRGLVDTRVRRPAAVAEAAARRIDQARAEFYPNVNLTSVIGLQSKGLYMLTHSGSSMGTSGPAISLPLHWTPDGLPVGVQFGADFGNEALLFRLGAQLEQARPWGERRPSASGWPGM